MRVCLIARQFPALSETFVVNQALGLLERGHEVVIVPERPALRDPASERVQQSGLMERVIRHPAISTRLSVWVKDFATLTRGLAVSKGGIARVVRGGVFDGRASIKTMFWAMRLLRTEGVDIVHSHFGPSALFAVAARRANLLSAPIVATVHGSDVTTLPNRGRGDMYRRGFQEVEALTVGSAFIAEKIIQLGAPQSKVQLIPQGIDTRTFFWRRRVRPDNRTFTLLTVARLVEVKGVDYAVRAVAAASTHISGLRYLIVGDGPERIRLERLANQLGIHDRVTFLGAQNGDAVLAAYDRSDAFMLSGVQTAAGTAEGQGLAVLEAMATGLPAIVSNVGGLPESVRHDVTGFLVAERDVQGLAHRVVELASQSTRRRAMGRAASADIRERFSLDAYLDRLELTYESVLTSPRNGKLGQ